MLTILHILHEWVRTRLGRLAIRPIARNQRGVALIEFAIAVPVLALLLLGMIDVVPALMAKFKVNQGSESAGDIATSVTQLQTSDMVNVYTAASRILAPLDATTLTLRITHVYSDGNGNVKVYWSCGQGVLPALTAQSSVTTTPTGQDPGSLVVKTDINGVLVGSNTGYVMVESQYTYTAIAKFFIRNPLLMTNTAYLQPRVSNYVGFPWNGNSQSSPPAPKSTTTAQSVTLSNGAICSYAA
jgi:Flp pilus assembly protein TadG